MLISTYKQAHRLYKALRDNQKKQASAEDALWQLERGYVLVDHSAGSSAISILNDRLRELDKIIVSLNSAIAAL